MLNEHAQQINFVICHMLVCADFFFYTRKASVNGVHYVHMAEQSQSPAISPQPMCIIALEQQRMKKMWPLQQKK